MSSDKKTEEKKDGDKKDEAAPAAPKKPSAVGGILKVVFPALLAAGAAYGGTRFAAAKAPAPAAAAGSDHAGGHGDPHGESSAGRRYIPKPPGPTLPLDPFLVTLFDGNRKSHAMKMSVAIEFDPHPQTHDDPKTLVPRIRDAILAHLRTLTHEQVSDSAHLEKIRVDLLEKVRMAGAVDAEKVLVTDFVVQ
jgi:flagellar basal body-associated protein FliL